MKNAILDVSLNYYDGIIIHENAPKKMKLFIENAIRQQQWLTLKWYLPTDWCVLPSTESLLNLDQAHAGTALAQTEFTIVPHNLCNGKYDVLLEIKSNGRAGRLFVPVTFIVG